MQELQGTLATIGQQQSGVEEIDYTTLLDEVQDPALIQVIQASVDEITSIAAQDGYGGLFYSAVVIALLVVVFTYILKVVRKKLPS